MGSTKHRYNSTQFSYVGNVDKISLLYEATMVDGNLRFGPKRNQKMTNNAFFITYNNE